MHTKEVRRACNCILFVVDRCYGVRNGLQAWQSIPARPSPVQPRHGFGFDCNFSAWATTGAQGSSDTRSGGATNSWTR